MTDDFSDPANWHPIEEHPYLNDPPKVTMPDNLRDRIANTLYQELSIELPAAIRGADAVIADLGLREERTETETVTNEQGAKWFRQGSYRYVTDWIPR